MNRADLDRLIDRLDHTGSSQQTLVRDELAAWGFRATEHIVSRLGTVPPGRRIALVEALASIGDPRSVLPLMRYVYDQRQNPAERQARRVAMEAILNAADTDHADRLFDFLVDMRHDPDITVRTLVLDGFARLDDPAGTAYVTESLDDPAEAVRRRARQTLDELPMDNQPSGDKFNTDELLEQIRTASGAELTYCVNLLQDRQDAFALAAKLVHEDGNRTMVGLEILQSLPNPKARRVAARHFQLTDSPADRAASLRVLAEHIDGDVQPNEARIIDQGLACSDKFVSLAALGAAGCSGKLSLTQRALQATRAGDSVAAVTAAESLAKGAHRLPARLVGGLQKSIDMINGHRRHNEQADLIRTEAYLLRALSRMLDPSDRRARSVQHTALDSLRNSADIQPIVITALEVLVEVTPDRGYPDDQRWHPADAAGLSPLLTHPNLNVCRRALEVVRRAAPGDTPDLCGAFGRLMGASPQLVSQWVIPAIVQTAGPNAKRQLAQLAVGDQSAVCRAAESGLRRLRNDQPHIDVEFRRASD